MRLLNGFHNSISFPIVSFFLPLDDDGDDDDDVDPLSLYGSLILCVVCGVVNVSGHRH